MCHQATTCVTRLQRVSPGYSTISSASGDVRLSHVHTVGENLPVLVYAFLFRPGILRVLKLVLWLRVDL